MIICSVVSLSAMVLTYKMSQTTSNITKTCNKCTNFIKTIKATTQFVVFLFVHSWEQRKFEEIAVRSSVICSDDTLPRVEYEDIVSGTGRLNKDIYAKQSSKSGIAFHQGDVLYGKLRPYLQNWLLPTFDGLAVGDFWVLQPQNADSSFLYRLIQSRQFDEVANQSTGTKMPRADWKLVSKTVFSIPSSISEQAAIGTYFTALDSLITLHQREFFRLILAFFCCNSTSILPISWEQRKLGDTVQITMGQSPDGSTYSDVPSDYILVQGNADLQNGWVSPRIWTSQMTKKADAGDLIMSVRAPAGAMGKTAYNAVIWRGVAAIKGNEFIYQLLVKMDSDGYWKALSCGSTFESLNSDNIKNADVLIPNAAEQKKIGQYFANLDNLITLHQCECLGNSHALSILPCPLSSRKMTSFWEQRKAKELFNSTADKGYPELPVLSATQDRGMIRRDENSINIFHDKKNESGYKRVLPGQFVIHLRSFQGGFAHSTLEGITSPAYTVFGFSEPEKHDSEYWKYVFTSKEFIRRLETVTYGIRDGRSISYDEFLTLDFVYPSKAEQTAIARYLDKLSDLITLHQRQLEKLKNIKSALLEKMFV